MKHPGEILLEELKKREMSQSQFAQETGYSAAFIGDVIHERRGLSIEASHRFAIALGTTAAYWWNLQKEYDFESWRKEHAHTARA